MHLEVFSICDAATASEGGKLNILGAFDSLCVGNLPAKHPHAAIAIRIRFNRQEIGHHHFQVMIAKEGNVHTRIEGDVRIGTPEPEVASMAVNLILNLNDAEFREAGIYEIVLHVDGRKLGSVPLNIRRHMCGKQVVN